MAELPAGDIPSIVQGALKVIGQVSAFVNAMKDLTEQHEQLRERFERLEREQEELRGREAAARRESEEAAEALAELRAAYEALLTEHETCSRTLHRLHEERSDDSPGRPRAGPYRTRPPVSDDPPGSGDEHRPGTPGKDR